MSLYVTVSGSSSLRQLRCSDCYLLHAVVAYWVANRLRKQMEDRNLAKASYPYQSLLYRSQTFFFAAKSIIIPAATASIIVLLFVMVWNPQPTSPTPTCCLPQCCGVTR